MGAKSNEIISNSVTKINVIYYDKNKKEENEKPYGHLVIINGEEEFNRQTSSGLLAEKQENSLVIKDKENILWRINHKLFRKN